MSSEHIQLYRTTEHACSYLPDRMASNIVPDPEIAMDMSLYSYLIKLGYRRSGGHVYRPHCNGCEECQPCRIPVRQFRPRKSQQRCLKKNQDLKLNMVKAGFSDEYFELYQKYLNLRHADGGMANPHPDDFKQFLYSEWSNTYFIEVRKEQRLLAVAVTDVTHSGLSAVYTFFDPDETRRGLGNFCILQQIQQTREMQHEHLYMGYWIKNCQKMKYKADFQPLETLIDNSWEIHHL
ncbi:MAG: arginyltransferase [Gammaproteobacteria bacterium]|nr:arginyltransferase [Gammaproteobacteria bacterium]MCW8924541.1 arginyltransferase [Gammaproteobacteria bacterium]